MYTCTSKSNLYTPRCDGGILSTPPSPRTALSKWLIGSLPWRAAYYHHGSSSLGPGRRPCYAVNGMKSTDCLVRVRGRRARGGGSGGRPRGRPRARRSVTNVFRFLIVFVFNYLFTSWVTVSPTCRVCLIHSFIPIKARDASTEKDSRFSRHDHQHCVVRLCISKLSCLIDCDPVHESSKFQSLSLFTGRAGPSSFSDCRTDSIVVIY